MTHYLIHITGWKVETSSSTIQRTLGATHVAYENNCVFITGHSGKLLVIPNTNYTYLEVSKLTQEEWDGLQTEVSYEQA